MGNTPEHVLITGGSGFIGRHLTLYLREKGYRVLTLSRNPGDNTDCFHWDPEAGLIDLEALRQADYIIHLAGAGIGDSRWTAKRKKEIVDSRVDSCRLLLQKVQETGFRPKAFVTASAVGYYGSAASSVSFTERDTAGSDFLASVCEHWEEAADGFMEAGIRTVKIRTGLVLAGDGGILPSMALPVRWGMGFTLGNGRQVLSWIHLRDLCEIYLKAIQENSWEGAFNATAPEPTDNRHFTRILAKVLHRPFWPIGIPAFLIRLALGERSHLLLKGNNVLPGKLIQEGFLFHFQQLETTVESIYQK